IPGIKIINSKEVKKFEPNVSAISALYVPTSGIIDPTGFVGSLNSPRKHPHLLLSYLIMQ
ncbi:MAG: hypothetical protein WCJ54_09040, partial [Actinomycetota bacterium]